MILTITGPSAAGKTVLLGNLRAARPDIRSLISTTTRSPRASDVEGEYRHVSHDDFAREVHAGDFLWHVEMHGNRYGTRALDVDHALRSGIYVAVLLVGAVRDLHVHALTKGMKAGMRSVYLRIDNEEEVRRRLTLRDGPSADVERRIADCRTWNAQAAMCGVRMRFIEATRPKEEVARTALAYLDKA
jgi:guanylate kinase